MRKFWVSVGKTRFDTKWKNREVTWEWLEEQLQQVTRTREKQAEYFKMDKAAQDKIKDVGGFVGGVLDGGRRKSDTVRSRSILTLDADYADIELWDRIAGDIACAAILYTTHKHRPEKPRFRVIIPLDRDVSPEEYEAVARKVAEWWGIDCFDDTTYQPSRLMYWPSCSIDGRFNSEVLPGDPLLVDDVLAEYPDWTDVASWPVSSRVAEVRRRSAEKQGDPRQKPGIVGAFCRAYDVPAAIDTFLVDVYKACGNGRYTYTAGSTAAGLVIYEDGQFAYSNHATDPASGQLCNAFDLVRLHKFKGKDDRTKPETSIEKRPSHKAMAEFASRDPLVRRLITEEATAGALAEFDDDYEDLDEIGDFSTTAAGLIEDTIRNGVIAIRRNPVFKGLRYNTLGGYIEAGDLPWPHTDRWSDSDEVQLRGIFEGGMYKFKRQTLQDAIIKVANDRSYNPVEEYLDGLPPWDETPRVDTLLVDYLGAEDSPYTRAVTRKTLCAAVRRIRIPGYKFDTILVLNGKQGCGKTTLLQKLGMKWYNDSLNLQDVATKTGAEKLQGYWILELGEMAGMRKTDIEALRGFISRTDDVYRGAYKRHAESHKRQCVLLGTTNAEDDGYLRDAQGNRRFWDVRVSGVSAKSPFVDLTQNEVDQIWAEVKVLEPNESLILTGELARVAEEKQNAAIEANPLQAMVEAYLDTMLPEDWYERSISGRKAWLDADLDGRTEGTMRREFVCNAEIWTECFGKPPGAITRRDSFEIANIMRRIDGWKKSGKAKKIPGYGTTKVYCRG